MVEIARNEVDHCRGQTYCQWIRIPWRRQASKAPSHGKDGEQKMRRPKGFIAACFG